MQKDKSFNNLKIAEKALKVSYVIITYNRKNDLEEVLNGVLGQNYKPIEIIVVDNNSRDGTENLFSNKFNLENIRYFRMEQNLGVSGGRNYGIRKASGDILITIDDDAVIDDSCATEKVVNRLNDDKSIGVLMFKIVNYYTDRLQKDAFPSRDKHVNPNNEFQTTWFIGAGHAIPRSVYDSVGLYREFRPWGSEDFDYSLRVINAGLRIVYFPAVVVRHKISESGRIADFGKFRGTALKHRLKVAVLNLPWYSVVTMSIIRSAQAFIATHGNVISLLQAYYDLFRDLPETLRQRSCISRRAIKRLRELKGPLYF